MPQHQETDIIDLRKLAAHIWRRRSLFYRVLPVTFVLSCLYIICIPRTYTTSTKLAPELENTFGGGTLGNIASAFGLDLSDAQTSDAITPLLYPDLMDDNGFVASLFSIRVKDRDGEIDTDYYTYLRKYQKRAWWTTAIGWVKNLFAEKDSTAAGKGGLDPYRLSKKQTGILNKIRDQITLNVDKKNGVISIFAEAQDPLICKTLADSVRTRLQEFITDYRTNKSRVDLEYYQKLAADAKHEYERARQLYGTYSDSHNDVILESYRAKLNDLENDMQLKYNAYSSLNAQLQQAKAKVQERTPAFTVIKGAEVPVKPSGPKRMIFVLGMLILAAIGTTLYILKDDFKNIFLQA